MKRRSSGGAGRKPARSGLGRWRTRRRSPADVCLDLTSGALQVSDGVVSGRFHCVLRTTRAVPLAVYYFRVGASTRDDPVGMLQLGPGTRVESFDDSVVLSVAGDAGERTAVFLAGTREHALEWVEQISRFVGSEAVDGVELADGADHGAMGGVGGAHADRVANRSGSGGLPPREHRDAALGAGGRGVDVDDSGEIESSRMSDMRVREPAHLSSVSRHASAAAGGASGGAAGADASRAAHDGEAEFSELGPRMASTDSAASPTVPSAVDRAGEAPDTGGSLRSAARVTDADAPGMLDAPTEASPQVSRTPLAHVFTDPAEEFSHYFMRSTPRDVIRALRGGAMKDSYVRVLAWFLLTGIIPSGRPTSTWPGAMRSVREQYALLRQRYWDRRGPHALLSETGELQNPEDLAESDSTARANIEKDVRRTCQSLDFFQRGDVQEMLTRALFVWDRAHPRVGYKQGMNELLAMVVWALHRVHLKFGAHLRANGAASDGVGGAGGAGSRSDNGGASPKSRMGPLGLKPGPGPRPLPMPASEGGRSRGRVRVSSVVEIADESEDAWNSVDISRLPIVYALCDRRFLEHDCYAMLDQIMRRLIVMYAPGGVVQGTEFVHEIAAAPDDGDSDTGDSDDDSDRSSRSGSTTKSDTEDDSDSDSSAEAGTATAGAVRPTLAPRPPRVGRNWVDLTPTESAADGSNGDSESTDVPLILGSAPAWITEKNGAPLDGAVEAAEAAKKRTRAASDSPAGDGRRGNSSAAGGAGGATPTAPPADLVERSGFGSLSRHGFGLVGGTPPRRPPQHATMPRRWTSSPDLTQLDAAAGARPPASEPIPIGGPAPTATLLAVRAAAAHVDSADESSVVSAAGDSNSNDSASAASGVATPPPPDAESPSKRHRRKRGSKTEGAKPSSRLGLRAHAGSGAAQDILADWTLRLGGGVEQGRLGAGEENPLLESLEKIQVNHLMVADPELGVHMGSVGVVPAMYLLRWRRLALSREFAINDTLLLWDAVIGETPDNWQLLDYLCVAMLLRVRAALLAADDAPSTLGVLTAISSHMPGVEVRSLVEDALTLRTFGSLQARDAALRHESHTGGADAAVEERPLGALPRTAPARVSARGHARTASAALPSSRRGLLHAMDAAAGGGAPVGAGRGGHRRETAPAAAAPRERIAGGVGVAGRVSPVPDRPRSARSRSRSGSPALLDDDGAIELDEAAGGVPVAGHVTPAARVRSPAEIRNAARTRASSATSAGGVSPHVQAPSPEPPSVGAVDTSSAGYAGRTGSHTAGAAGWGGDP
uniref:Rab-GAP TBC domain-containing protein n=1 Tax=Bicosoecida sp. CB-2014 TaxID=1486930 RepID=A0A7S1GCV7_9STRA|mmetsp:Transcript_4237/g.15627  ORF Transcript_4237/g.15627 Transcript_4237/m.15627 type:complete len:1288 (+) Transcript_4237:214-4077(+)